MWTQIETTVGKGNKAGLSAMAERKLPDGSRGHSGMGTPLEPFAQPTVARHGLLNGVGRFGDLAIRPKQFAYFRQRRARLQ
ncbi:hypothetical protein [Rhodoblastus acidophilus]|uniref:hypothetical protein n=1 Tax=Rhodoblastus acidophilus TaxID=1074 RepID=UPI0011300F15|nr:hypothetical protein [Rhodoblastus acidophilus]MCW2318880.1 hypothetical protein [Rhodoblastus acidophilus]